MLIQHGVTTGNHLRNHGFLLDPMRGWRLSPAYDVNSIPDGGAGLKLNVDQDRNDLDVALALDVAPTQDKSTTAVEGYGTCGEHPAVAADKRFRSTLQRDRFDRGQYAALPTWHKNGVYATVCVKQ